MVIGLALLCLSSFNQKTLAGITPDYEGIDVVNVEEEAVPTRQVNVGLGVGTVPDYEGSEDYEAVPLLFVRMQWPTGRYLEFLGNRLEANVLASNAWSFGPMIRYRHKRDDDVDNDVIARMREVDESVEVGVFLGLQIGNWNAGINAAQDVADGHDGYLVRLATGYTLPVNPCLMLGGNLFTTYADDDYMDAYFSVDADNAARSGLPRYNAGPRFKDVGGMLTAQYAPWEKWGIMGIVGYARLLGKAKNSPVVDDEGDNRQYFGGLMATYQF
jgi:outer membrane protein